MGINVEVDKAITSGKPFSVTLSVDDGEDEGTFDMTVKVNHVAREFSVRPPTPPSPPALVQVLDVEDQNTWTVLNWGTAKQGDPVEVKLTEHAPGIRSSSDEGAVV